MANEGDELRKKIKEIEELRKKLNASSSISEQNKLLQEQNKLLEEAGKYYDQNKALINQQAPALKDNLDKLKETNNSLQDILLVNKGITKTFSEMTTESAKFSRSTDEWFKKGELLAEQYFKVSKNIGLSEKQSRLVANNFNAAVRESLLLGTSISELEQMMTQFADDTGRARILGEEELENLSLIKEGTGLFETEVASMAEQFDLMGISSQEMVNVLNSAIGSSREMGLNSGKVIKTLQSNFKMMQQYSFASGVKGMTEMAKQAVRMRVDVSEVLQMADKFYQPEAAIEAAANLQLLGGDIAKAFGDPFETMYLARNKPEELAKRVGQMTENMVSFNEQTGEFDFPAEARMQLQAVSKELGIGMDSLTEMTRQTSKIKSIKMNVSGNILDEDMREGIAGMARMKDGKWVVDFAEGGKTFTKSIDELTSEQAKLVMDQEKENKDKTDTDYLREIALYTQTFSEKVANITESQQFGFAAEMDVYGTTMDAFLSDTIDTYKVESNKMFTALTDSFGPDGLRGALRESFIGADGEGVIEEQIRTVFSNMTNAINKSAESGNMSFKELKANATDISIFTGAFGKAFDIKVNGGDGTYVMGPKGSFKLDGQDEYYGKDGGFVAGTDLFGGTIKSTSSSVSTSNNNVNINGTIDVRGPQGTIAQFSPDEIKKLVMRIMAGDDASGGKSSNMSAMYQNT